jgi:hypothetical protein
LACGDKIRVPQYVSSLRHTETNDADPLQTLEEPTGSFSPDFYINEGDLSVDRPGQVSEASRSSNSESSWIERCYTKVTTAVSAADTALRDSEAGSAIKIAYDLFSSLLALEGDGTDNSVEGRYISELTLHTTSLKDHWSNVSAVWSNFMINIGKVIPEMQLKVHEGFLGNYPIQTT